MAKRPYYIISYSIDCDGYDYYIAYIGTNYRAACNRYNWLCDYLKKIYFADEGFNDEQLNLSVSAPPDSLEVTRQHWSYMNDDRDCYIGIGIQCVNTDKFFIPAQEAEYIIDYPNSVH